MDDKDSKLWESKFDGSADDLDDDQVSESGESLSRIDRTKRHNNKLLVGGLVAFLLVAMFVPVVWSTLISGHEKSAISNSERVSVSSKPKKVVTHKKAKSEKKTAAKKTQKSKEDQSNSKSGPEVGDSQKDNSTTTDTDANNQAPAANSQNNGTEVGSSQKDNSAAADTDANSQAPAANNQNNNSTTTANNSPAASNIYTVQPKDNAYRIAVNHGMSLDDFYRLNGRVALHPGMTVKVK
ncbi:LysM peptidoglycan-binding domain-containing protein [Lactobacillus sp. DCY120]|uniref:LysM peptidoglycan-binding domain-containing protein n=1 Tax=Bombilactobacillus apium TaxID=2675299 RepID=A0A850R5D6_9LACO|nr:LysM domain-containing protein [Bombilactobacillus apium]NVY95755.1 LysM peptidoglycan-binding domain-containing protein [Bombilactobacillus apium]